MTDPASDSIMATDNTPTPTPAVKKVAMNLATISSGFEKGDFLVREEKGQRVYFDFFEEAFNYVANKGYVRCTGNEEAEWIQTFSEAHNSVKGGMRYNTGKLLMILTKPVDIAAALISEDKNGDSKFVGGGKDENTLV
eukprot:CAMPEP_0203634506 /NCGR_PEP_ID=MMETSP0088-20131115/1426_1 /ASSEMBLY_ACC=CAM_ASM_001087 /TAXON_ID=426623 /ORGANISM="Chaetoceros affinis, Strain CCMP159" /LENGTH=137 /DNA_ID=CAMNT_0050488121 /DNA_START=25 /DNA_END=438 /DNA_ORIENTATION=+